MHTKPIDVEAWLAGRVAGFLPHRPPATLVYLQYLTLWRSTATLPLPAPLLLLALLSRARALCRTPSEAIPAETLRLAALGALSCLPPSLARCAIDCRRPSVSCSAHPGRLDDSALQLLPYSAAD